MRRACAVLAGLACLLIPRGAEGAADCKVRLDKPLRPLASPLGLTLYLLVALVPTPVSDE